MSNPSKKIKPLITRLGAFLVPLPELQKNVHFIFKKCTFHFADYNFEKNRIGIILDNKNEKIELSEYEKVGEKEVFKHSNTISQFIISEKLLPSLIYCALHDEKEIISAFFSFRANFEKFLTAVADGEVLNNPELQNLSNTPESKEKFEKFLKEEYKLQPKWIPSKIRDFILNVNKTNKKDLAIQKIDKLIERANFLAYGESKTMKKRKELSGFFHFSFKKGDKATEVARDIIRMMTKDEKNEKLSSAEYNLLQSLLALNPIEDCTPLFKRHPFLDNTKSSFSTSTRIDTFFTEYFESSKVYLQELREELSNGEIQPDDSKLHFIDYDSIVDSQEDLKEYVKNLLSKENKQRLHPIYIPDDLLKDKVLEINGENAENKRSNINYALMLGLDKNEKQWFYNRKFREKDKNINEKTLDRIFNHEWLKDTIVWQMIKKNANEELKKALKNLSLENYKVPENRETGSDHILSTEISQEIEFTLKETHSSHIPKNEERKVKVQIKRKLKDLGAYRHLLKDFRVPYILGFYPDYFNQAQRAIDVGVVETELDFYNSKRLDILKEIFAIEEYCYNQDLNKYNNLLNKEDGHINFKDLIHSFFPTVSEELKAAITDIRNALLHNKIPKNFALEDTPKTDKLACELFFEKCSNIIKEFIPTKN